jgi:acetyl esterase/lipase
MESRLALSTLGTGLAGGVAEGLTDRAAAERQQASSLRPVSPAMGTALAASLPLRNVRYTSDSGRAETLDVILPAGPPPPGGWPVVVAIHGGGWAQYTNRSIESTAAQFTPYGFAVVAPNYTLSTRSHSSWPTALLDVRGSVRWVRAHAGQYGFDPNHIAAFGMSAGGNLAALLGTSPGADRPGQPSAQVQAVIDFYGPADLVSLVRESPAAGARAIQFLGGLPGQFPARYHDASPADLVTSGTAPMLIIHGSADPLVPVDQSEELAARLTAAGVANRLIVVPGAKHGFGLTSGSVNLLPDAVGFLQTYL